MKMNYPFPEKISYFAEKYFCNDMMEVILVNVLHVMLPEKIFQLSKIFDEGRKRPMKVSRAQ